MGDVAVRNNDAIVSKLVLHGDLSGLTETEKATYYTEVCHSLELNPLTKPFDILTLKGKQVLYAKREAAEQLRKLNGISIQDMTTQVIEGVYVVRVKGMDKSGRTDMATGAVPIANLQGENLANAMLKAETKAKRRLTLSISGLGMLDETEVESIPGAQTRDVTPENKDSEELQEARKYVLDLVRKAREHDYIDDERQASIQDEVAKSTSVNVLRARYDKLNNEFKQTHEKLNAKQQEESAEMTEEQALEMF